MQPSGSGLGQVTTSLQKPQFQQRSGSLL